MFIPYLGEKSKFSNFIIPNIPSEISTYVEPFGGMFGIFFSMNLKLYPDTKFIYNDQNEFNYNLFECLKDKELFIKRIKDININKDKYCYIQKNLFNNNWDKVEKAIYWLAILCCSRSQYDILNGEWKGDSEFEVFKYKLKYDIKLDRINDVSNRDYKIVISEYDSDSTFFYLDPPYKGKEEYYINHNFNQKSHYDLYKSLENIKGKFALSYYHFPDMDIWYKDYNIINRKTLMGTEYLIMNYDL